jgi:hypothetical protein
MNKIPNGEQICVAYYRQFLDDLEIVTDFSTKLPDVVRWTKPVFVTVEKVTGLADPYWPENQAFIRLDVWGQATHINEVSCVGESLKALCYGNVVPVTLDIKRGFYRVSVKDLMLIGDPHPMRSSTGDLARVTMDVAMVYVLDSEVTA